MTGSSSVHAGRSNRGGSTELTITSSRTATFLPSLYAVRGAIAVAWAGAFATVSDSLTAAAATLLVLYPLIDVIASLIDSRTEHSRSERRTLWFGATTSTIAATALIITGRGEIADVLRVFGVWATVSGITQILVAIRRRSTETGGQWPMLVAGALSTLVGIFYNIEASGAGPTLDALVTYAAAGGAFFVIQAGILTWRLRRTAHPHAHQ